ncbi:hypothetical protein [Streptosporangium sp. G12]
MAMSDYPREAWQRLGRLLRSRRAHISPDYRNRGEFCKATGLNYKLVQEIEGAARDTFTDESFALFETGYRLTEGSIRRALAGGELTPADRDTSTASPVAAEAKAPAAEPEDGAEIDWESFAPQTPTEKALFALYQASRREMDRKLEEINDRIDRLAERDEGERKLA